MQLFDTHAHVNEKRFQYDQKDMLLSCFEAGVTHILCPGTDYTTSAEGIALAKEYREIYAAVGVHPHASKDVTEAHYEAFYTWATSEEKVVAIGEIGLDYYYDFSDRESQKKAFIRQIALAKELDMPIIIHDREAHGDIMDILRKEGKGVRGIFHCFSGSYEMARQAIQMGFYISFAGPVVFPKSTSLKEVARLIPMDYLLIETDSPYLTPPPFRGRRNQPSYVYYVAEEIGKLRNVSTEEVAAITLQNGKRILGIK